MMIIIEGWKEKLHVHFGGICHIYYLLYADHA